MSRVMRGLGVSPGVAVGRALPWQQATARQPEREPPTGSDSGLEVERFASARRHAGEELRALKWRLMTTLGETYAAILDAQTMLLDDPALIAEVESKASVAQRSRLPSIAGHPRSMASHPRSEPGARTPLQQLARP